MDPIAFSDRLSHAIVVLFFFLQKNVPLFYSTLYHVLCRHDVIVGPYTVYIFYKKLTIALFSQMIKRIGKKYFYF